MKRSDINTIIGDTIQYLQSHQFYLPEWGYWTIGTWRKNIAACENIVKEHLGWDITDFGGTFSKTGLVLFTIRNGSLEADMRPYCEKILVMRAGQVAPYHYHKHKTEDIINRGATPLALTVAPAHANGEMGKEAMTIVIDGIRHEVSSGQEITLMPGQSITLYPHDYHCFYPKRESAFIGEVSKTNDDIADNFFLEPLVRFPHIEEDAPIIYPTVNDYAKL